MMVQFSNLIFRAGRNLFLFLFFSFIHLRFVSVLYIYLIIVVIEHTGIWMHAYLWKYIFENVLMHTSVPISLCQSIWRFYWNWLIMNLIPFSSCSFDEKACSMPEKIDQSQLNRTNQPVYWNYCGWREKERWGSKCWSENGREQREHERARPTTATTTKAKEKAKVSVRASV